MADNSGTNGTGITMLDSLATEARAYAESAAMNLFQLGRVYTEAKKLIPHGGWQDWVRENGGMSERGAQQVMQLYARFGNNPVFRGVDKSKLLKMLSLPAGKEEAFATEHDVGSMTSRAVEEAVKHEREKAKAELDRERTARQEAEKRAEELENRPPSIPDDIAETLQKKDEELQTLREEVERQTEITKELMDENKGTERLKQELQEAETLLEEKQAEYNHLQAEMLDAKSVIARGETQAATFRPMRDNQLLTLDAFAAAVRQFTGACAPLPMMAQTFSEMDTDGVAAYDGLLRTVEAFVRSARRTLDTVKGEGIIDDGQ